MLSSFFKRLVRAVLLWSCLVLSALAPTAAAAAPPVVVSVGVPANGWYGELQPLDFIVRFDQNVSVFGGAPRIALFVGSTTRYADYYLGGGGDELFFRYFPRDPDFDADGITVGAMDLNGGAIRNAGNEDAVLVLNSVGSTAAVNVDTIPPTVSMSLVGAPPASATSIQYQVTFSKLVTGLDVSDFILSTTGTVFGAVQSVIGTGTPTYLVTISSIVGTGTLGVGIVAGAAFDVAGNPTPAYSGVSRPVGMYDATLSQLVPSTGALSPPFSLSTSSYALSVSNAVQQFSLTPTATDAGSAITVNGVPVASGTASDPEVLPVGAKTFTVAITAPDTVTTQTYTVTVTRAASTDASLSGLVPSAGTLSPGFASSVAAYSVTVPNSVQSFSLVPSTAEAGATITVNNVAVASGTASVPQALPDGESTFTVVVTAPDGVMTRTYTVTVLRGAADPSLDAEVQQLAGAQADAAKGLARSQMRNFGERLEQLHNDAGRRRSTLDVQIALSQFGPDATQAMAYLPRIDPLAGVDLGPLALWSGGFVDFGKSGGGLDLSHVTVGVSGGLDYRFSDMFVGGAGLGFGRDRSEIGDNGSQSTATSVSGAIYGSFQPGSNFYIDGLVGAGSLDFDNKRFIAAGDFANGKRVGRQFFGALTASYEWRDGNWLLSPFGRLDASRSWLDGYAETGGAGMALAYGDQTIDSLAASAGIRAQYDVQMEWGTLTPGLRAEYSYGSQRAGPVSLGYAGAGLPYVLEGSTEFGGNLALGLSMDARMLDGVSLGVDYRASLSENYQSHGLGLRVRAQF